MNINDTKYYINMIKLSINETFLFIVCINVLILTLIVIFILFAFICIMLLTRQIDRILFVTNGINRANQT